MERLWHTDQTTLSPDLRLYIYWHQRLQHLSHVTMVRLAKRGVIPARISRVKKAPPCAACLFAKAQRRAWRSRKKAKSIRKTTDSDPRKGTSVDHMISRQPGLIPQVTGTLTHDRYWGSVTVVDHASNFSYSHIIQSTLNSDMVEAKDAHEIRAQLRAQGGIVSCR